MMNKGKKLEKLVLATIMAGSLVVGNSAFASAIDEYENVSTQENTISFGGKPFSKLYYFEKGNIGEGEASIKLKELGKDEKKYFNSINGALGYWHEILGTPTAGTPDIYIYSLEKGDELYAAASSNTDEKYSNTELTNYFLMNDYKVEEGAAAAIHINTDSYVWNFNDLSPLTQGSTGHLTTTLVHEMFHALGVVSNSTDELAGKKKEYNAYYELNKTNTTTYEKHLYDMYGHNLGESKYIYGFDVKTPPKEIDKDTFYVRTDVNPENMDGSSYGGVYFKGRNVDEVLTVNGEMAKLAWPDDEDNHLGLGKVEGIPVNSIEIEFDDPEGADEADYAKNNFEFELSHFELQNSLQSHQNYRNWGIPMEVELAAMQDMGFNIDRRKFYGYSIYNSGITYENNHPFYAWENGKYVEGKANKENYGIGLHIYGSNNNINQKADLLADGDESMGVRVDGSNNSLTIAKEAVVTANGKNGRGVNFTYGKEHMLNVEGVVKATGLDGIALSFDFGDNMAGNDRVYRGSYINVKPNKDYEGPEDENSAFNNVNLGVLDGALVSSVEISGTVEGNGAAIYISENALVNAIHVEDGAVLKGDIISDWSPKGISDVLEGKDLVEGNICLPEDKDGLTKLQFEGEALSYAGNIESNSYDHASIIMNVISGTLNYGGEASVDSVNVLKGAILQGGSFKLDAGKTHIRSGFDSDSGTITNEGMISAALPNGEDTVLKIEGNVKSKGGTFGFIANGNNVGTIKITKGDVYCDDNGVVLAVNPNGIYLPGTEYDISKMVTVDGSALVYNKAIDYKSGMLVGSFDEEINTLTFKAENNLNSTDATVNAAFAEMDNLAQAVAAGANSEEKQQLSKLFAMEGKQFAKVVKSIKGNETANAGTVMQQSNLVHNALGMRLSQVNRAKAVKVNVPIKQLTEGEAVNIPMEITAQPEYSMWAKINRNKGAVNAASDYKTDAYSIGWDKQVSKDWRFGFFGSYAKGKFEADTIHNSLEDYRLGVYGGYNKGAAEAMVYADYGWGRNELSRGLAGLAKNTNAKYNSNIMELGVEYKYDLQHKNNKTWHVAPYGSLQLNRYSQSSYAETGADPYNQNVDKLNNTYAGLEAGVDLERRFANGSAYGMRIGYRRGLTGVEPKQNYHYAADPAHRYTNYGETDKNKLVFSLNGEVQTAPNWSVSAEAGYERGKKGHGYSGEITLKYTW